MDKDITLTSKSSGRGIFAWCLYDWASQAFATLVTTFIVAAYFTTSVAVNPTQGTAQWGFTITASGVIIALFSPIFGAIADYYGRRKPWLMGFTFVAVIASFAIWFVLPSPEWVRFALTCVIIGTIGFEVAMVFYNAMLHDLVPKNYYGRVSGWGWGLGYVGGVVCLLISLMLVKMPATFGLDTATAQHVRITGPLVAIWFMIFATPLLIFTPDLPSKMTLQAAVSKGVREFLSSLRTIATQEKNVFYFLIAHMIYIDGMNTLFAFGGIYAAGTFGFGTNDIIILGIALNIGAGLGAGTFAWLDDWLGPKRSILIAIVGLLATGIPLVMVSDVNYFWALTIILSVFVGPVQASSRSFLAHIAPPAMVTECFGLFAFSGKATAFLGPWFFGLATLQFNSQRAGMATILLFLLSGALLLNIVQDTSRE